MNYESLNGGLHPRRDGEKLFPWSSSHIYREKRRICGVPCQQRNAARETRRVYVERALKTVKQQTATQRERQMVLLHMKPEPQQWTNSVETRFSALELLRSTLDFTLATFFLPHVISASSRAPDARNHESIRPGCRLQTTHQNHGIRDSRVVLEASASQRTVLSPETLDSVRFCRSSVDLEVASLPIPRHVSPRSSGDLDRRIGRRDCGSRRRQGDWLHWAASGCSFLTGRPWSMMSVEPPQGFKLSRARHSCM